MKSLSHVRLLVTPWTASYQAPPPMGFSQQAYWSGVPLPSPVMKARSMQSSMQIQLGLVESEASSWLPYGSVLSVSSHGLFSLHTHLCPNFLPFISHIGLELTLIAPF